MTYECIYRLLIKVRSFFKSAHQTKTLAERYPQYSIGNGSYGTPEILSWGEGGSLKIGAYTSIARGVKILLGGEHRPDWVTTYPFNVLQKSERHYKGHPKTKGDVVIGSDVWIGADVMLLSGISIGHGSVIGARAVVAKDVPPYAIVVGNPARVIKYRFAPATIEQLLKIEWWQWDCSKINKAMPFLLSNNINDFIDKAVRGYFD